MARTDAIVLGAGIVGTSAALHLAKRGLSVALIDRAGAGRGDLLRQCRHHRGQHLFPTRFRPSSARSCGSRSSARRRQTIISRSCRRSRPGCSPIARLARRRGMRNSRGDAAAVCARGRRARDADGGSRRRAISAQERLAQGLSHRAQLRGDASASSNSPRVACRSRRSISRRRLRSSRDRRRCSSRRCTGRRRRA